MANPEKRFLQNLTHSGVVLGGVNALGPYSSMFFFACSVVKPLSKFVENRSHSSDGSTTWTSNSSSCLRSSNFSVGNKGRINFLRSDFNDTKKLALVNLPFPFPSFFFTIVPATVSPSRKKTTSSLGRWLKNARWRLPPKQVFPGRRHLQALLFWCCCWDGKARAEFSQVLRITKASRKQVSPFYSYTVHGKYV